MPIQNLVEIAGSGTIEVTEGANDGEGEANSYNTDIQPYSTILDKGDTITVNS